MTMKDTTAKTIAEAEAQTFTVPEYDDWRSFAHMLNSYAILEEIGEDWGKWQDSRWEDFYKTGGLELSVLDARVLLFSKLVQSVLLNR